MSNEEAKPKKYGSSATLLDYVLKQQVADIGPKEIVDFGAGGGKNGRLMREVLGNDCKLVAVEGYEKTAQMLGEQGIYDEVRHDLLQKWLEENSEHRDLAIFGDVLEHLTHKQIYRVLDDSLKSFDHVIVVAPLHDLFQDASYGNTLEIHRTYITSRFFDRYNPIEKHIAKSLNKSEKWTIMNVRLSSKRQEKTMRRRFLESVYHYSILALQPVGLARPFHKFADSCLERFRGLLGED